MALILDVTSSSAVYAGRLLVEAGHRVVRIEPSAGDDVRRKGPFLKHRFNLEDGAFHQFMNAGKESFTLNPGSKSAEEVLHALLRHADCALVTLPGTFDGAGVRDVLPRLALVEIDDIANELCAFAQSGLLSVNGHPGKAPVLLGGHAALTPIGVYAAVAASAALLGASRGGDATRVKVSAAQCLDALTEQAALTYHSTGEVQTRRGFRGAAATAVSGGFVCADGYWMLSVPTTPNGWSRFMEWVGDPVLSADPFLADEDHRHQKRDLILERLGVWSAQRRKDELVEEAQERHIPSSPVSTTDDLARDPQLLARGFLQRVEHPEFGQTLLPAGAIAQSLGNPPRLAPRLGEQTQAILAELGYSESEQQALFTSGVV